MSLYKEMAVRWFFFESWSCELIWIFKAFRSFKLIWDLICMDRWSANNNSSFPLFICHIYFAFLLLWLCITIQELDMRVPLLIASDTFHSNANKKGIRSIRSAQACRSERVSFRLTQIKGLRPSLSLTSHGKCVTLLNWECLSFLTVNWVC